MVQMIRGGPSSLLPPGPRERPGGSLPSISVGRVYFSHFSYTETVVSSLQLSGRVPCELPHVDVFSFLVIHKILMRLPIGGVSQI